MGFYFNETNIRNLTKVICIIYQLFKSFTKIYKVQSHKELMSMYKEIIANKINVLNLFEIDNPIKVNEMGRRYSCIMLNQ